MPIALEKYAEIIDHYCIVYIGPNQDYIKQLIAVRPTLEKQFGISIFLALDKQQMYLVENEERVLDKEDLAARTREFACIREIRENFISNPIDSFLNECKVNTSSWMIEQTNTG